MKRRAQAPEAVKNYRLIPGALKWIEGVLRQENLGPIPPSFRPDQAARQRKRFYMTPVRYRGGVAWFKASLKAEPRLLRGLRHEMAVQRSLADYGKRSRTSFESPAWLAGSNHPDRAWLLRKYWTGPYGGDMQNDFGWSTKFIRAVKPQRMVDVTSDIGRMSGFMRRRLVVPVHGHNWYRLDYHYYQRVLLPPFLKHRFNPGWTQGDLAAWEKLLNRHRKFLNNQVKFFTHGDFYPNNLMLTGQGKQRTIVVFDWELANWNLPSFDAVLTWVLAWRFPAWQASFRKAYFKRAGNTPARRRAWNLAQFSIGVRLLAYAFVRRTNRQPERFGNLPRRQWKIADRMMRTMVTTINQAVASL